MASGVLAGLGPESSRLGPGRGLGRSSGLGDSGLRWTGDNQAPRLRPPPDVVRRSALRLGRLVLLTKARPWPYSIGLLLGPRWARGQTPPQSPLPESPPFSPQPLSPDTHIRSSQPSLTNSQTSHRNPTETFTNPDTTDVPTDIRRPYSETLRVSQRSRKKPRTEIRQSPLNRSEPSRFVPPDQRSPLGDLTHRGGDQTAVATVTTKRSGCPGDGSSTPGQGSRGFSQASPSFGPAPPRPFPSPTSSEPARTPSRISAGVQVPSSSCNL